MTDRPFLLPADVMELMGCKRSAAYELIRKLNKELQAKGFITLHGRVSKKYFFERMCLEL